MSNEAVAGTPAVVEKIEQNGTAPQAIDQAQIDAYRKEQRRKCGEAIAQVVAEFDCALVANPIIADGRIVAEIQIVNK